MYSLHLNANFSDYGQRNRKWFPNGCSSNNTRWATNQTKYKRNEKNNKLTGSLLWRWMWSKRVLSGNKSPPVTDPSPYPFGPADVVPSDIHSRGSLRIPFLSKLNLEIGIIHVTSHLHLIPSEIAKSFAQAVHFNTFGGNPIASAVGKAVLEV